MSVSHHGNCGADETSGRLQALPGNRGVDSSQNHHERRLDVPSCQFEHAAGLCIIHAGDGHDDAFGTLDQLLVGHLKVDHHVPVHLAESDHRGGGDHVEDQLLRGAAFHARRAHDDFRTHHRADGHVHVEVEFRTRVTRHEQCFATELTRMLDGAYHVRRATARRNAANNVLCGDAGLLDVPNAVLL